MRLQKRTTLFSESKHDTPEGAQRRLEELAWNGERSVKNRHSLIPIDGFPRSTTSFRELLEFWRLRHFVGEGIY